MFERGSRAIVLVLGRIKPLAVMYIAINVQTNQKGVVPKKEQTNSPAAEIKDNRIPYFNNFSGRMVADFLLL